MATWDEAEIVVIGGGAVGCGVAYRLAKAGKTDVLVVEKADELGSETTAQGAGLCGQVRSTVERTQLAMHSVATFNELERDPDVRPGWHQVGSLRIAMTEEFVAEFAELESIAAQAGLDVSQLDIDEARRFWPLLDWRNVKGVLWCASDGYMDPRSVVRSYAHQSSKLGVRFATGVSVRGIEQSEGRVTAVQTSRGRIACSLAINAAGAHAYHVARLAGLELPIVPVRHEYFVSVPMSGLNPAMPCFRVPDLSLYGRVAGEGLLLGGWEGRSLRADPRSYALEAPAPPIDPDMAVLGAFADRFAQLLPQTPALEHTRVAKGWPTFTPDGSFIIGESSQVRGFAMAGGCNAHGISGSAGIGRLLVDSLYDESPSDYVRSLSPDRFVDGEWDWETASRQAQRVYETYYGVDLC